MTYDLIILTDQRYINDDPEPYKHNVYYEDDLVVEACRSCGLRVTRKAWDDPLVNWSMTKAILFRSTWDYFDRFDSFSQWLNDVSLKTKLFNSKALIQWNIDKHYLTDLSQSGVAIPKTHFIERGSKLPLKTIFTSLDWSKAVLKPCVSGAGRHTYLIENTSVKSYESIFKVLIAQEDMMLQEFQENIVAQGEISMMVFNGKFTHAVLKKAKAGDFRVQDDFGGTVHEYRPSQEEIDFTLKAVNACNELPLYARVDIFYDNNNHLALGELELVEPELWFRLNTNAASVLAHAIKDRLKTIL